MTDAGWAYGPTRSLNGLVFRFDGQLIHVAAHHNIGGAELDAILSVFPIRPGRGSVAGRAIESRRIVHIEDLAQDHEPEEEHQSPEGEVQRDHHEGRTHPLG